MSYVYTTLVDDTFPQSDGPLSPVHWQLATAGGNRYPWVRAHLLETVDLAGGSIIMPTASGWVAGRQFVEVTIPNLAGLTDGTNFILIMLFSDLALDKGLFPDLEPRAGGNLQIKVTDVDDVPLGAPITLPFVAGAKYRIESFDGTVTHFYNGVQVGQYTSAEFLTATGIPGLWIECLDALNNLQISRVTAGNISLAPPPPPTSIREQIMQTIQSLLGGAGGPAGLTVHRERLRPIEKETLPAILFYADDDAPKPLAGVKYGAPLGERQLSLVVECRADAATTPADQALDPLLVWATQVIMQNEKFAGLANGVDEDRTVWLSREGEIALAAAAIHFTVKYRTALDDPTKKDPKS